MLTALPQLRSPHLLAALPPVQPAVSPSSSQEGLPTTQAEWFGPRGLSWPAALPGPSFVLWEGSWPPSRGDCSGAFPHEPPCFPFSPFGSPRPSNSQLTPLSSDSSSEHFLNSPPLDRECTSPGIPFLSFSPSLPAGGSEGSSWGLRVSEGLRAQHLLYPLGPRPRAPGDLLGLLPLAPCLECRFLPLKTQPRAPSQIDPDLTTLIASYNSFPVTLYSCSNGTCHFLELRSLFC